MIKSPSLPNLSNNQLSNIIKRSKSYEDTADNLFIFESFFEGDGPLGICFIQNELNEICISQINEGTVANETYGLLAGMKLINVNNEDIKDYSYQSVMKKMGKSWNSSGSVYLSFKKNINLVIYNALSDINLLEYYDDFIELGAKEMIDFEFVEYSDLIKLDMNPSEIERFKQLNPTIKCK